MHRFRSWQLLAVCVGVWGTTWHAVTYQIAPIAPEVAVALRFFCAGALVLAGCAWRGLSLRFSAADHARLAAQGGLLYGLAYLGVYYAERHLASGLVAVGYSASPLIAGLGARVLFGTPMSRRFIAGGLLGLGGVALIFWPEFDKASDFSEAAIGAAFTCGAVLLSTVGSLAASRNRSGGLAFWPAFGFGMVYGGLVCGVLAVGRGESFALPSTAAWWLSWIYLVLAGSVLAFACFLTLQDRLGPGPTGTVGVLTPLLALVVSIALEGFRPDAFTAAGALLAVVGNVLILQRAGRPARPARAGEIASAAVSPAPTAD